MKYTTAFSHYMYGFILLCSLASVVMEDDSNLFIEVFKTFMFKTPPLYSSKRSDLSV